MNKNELMPVYGFYLRNIAGCKSLIPSGVMKGIREWAAETYEAMLAGEEKEYDRGVIELSLNIGDDGTVSWDLMFDSLHYAEDNGSEDIAFEDAFNHDQVVTITREFYEALLAMPDADVLRAEIEQLSEDVIFNQKHIAELEAEASLATVTITELKAEIETLKKSAAKKMAKATPKE